MVWSFNPLQWGLLILTQVGSMPQQEALTSFNPLQWGLLILTCSNGKDSVKFRKFQSPSMGLIDSYAMEGAKTGQLESFNPLQWGLLILTRS